MDWYYASTDRHVGPFSTEQMAGLLRAGAISSETSVWHAGLDAWTPAATALGLPAGPPPLPPMRPNAGRPSAAPRRRGPAPAPGRWAKLTVSQRAVAVMSAFAAALSFIVVGFEPVMGGVFLGSLIMLAGAVWLALDTGRGQRVVLGGTALNGMILVWVLMEIHHGWLVIVVSLLTLASAGLVLSEVPAVRAFWTHLSGSQIAIIGLSVVAAAAPVVGFQMDDLRDIRRAVDWQAGTAFVVASLAIAGSASQFARASRAPRILVMTLATACIGALSVYVIVFMPWTFIVHRFVMYAYLVPFLLIVVLTLLGARAEADGHPADWPASRASD